jgi:outer membrane protein assembly factor BamB
LRKRKMKNLNKKLAISIAILLTISMSASIMLIPSTTAHSPAWQIPTYSYIVAAPNPVGIGQATHIYIWLDPVFGAAGGTTAAIGTNGSTASAALLSNGYRFHNYNLTIVAPDGHATTQIFETISDPTSSQFIKFTPDQLGTYTLYFSYPGEVYGANGNGYEGSPLYGDTYLGTSTHTTLTVQQDPLPDPITSYPLPQNYWSHPIYGENTDWWAISSNWLGSGSPVPGGTSRSSSFSDLYHNDAIGPLTSHVMWTRPLQFGGVVGGNQFIAGGSTPSEDGSAQGAMYYEGSSYNPRFVSPIIINGYLFYTEPVSFTGGHSGPTTAIDLRTGQVLWSRSDVPALSFGYIYNVWNQDEHGTFPPILFTSNFGQAFDAYTGDALFNVTNVPSGTSVMGPSGEILRYVIRNAGTNANPAWYLSQWNSSKLWQYDINPYVGSGSNPPSIINASNGLLVIGQVGNEFPIPITGAAGRPGNLPNGGFMPFIPYDSTFIVDADIPINSTNVLTYGGNGDVNHGLTTYDWNISIPWRNTMPNSGSSAPTVVAANYGDIMLLRSGSLPSGFAATGTGANQVPYTYFAVNLNRTRGTVGSVLWTKTYDPPAGNLTVNAEPVDFQNRVFTFSYGETMQWVGYSLNTGDKIWGPTPSQGAWDYYGYPGTVVLPGTIAYGKLYDSSFGGILYAYDDLTGELLWTYGNGGAGNSTNAGLQVFYGDYPTQIQSISNGVVYTATDEHTIPNPLYKGSTYRAINATDGTEIWQLSGYPSEWSSGGSEWAAADGFLTMMNGLDNNIYSVGRGPSALTVATSRVLTQGSNVVIDGTVIDVSAGTKQATQAADFPNGVPVASDASMKDWMGYVYQQKPLPTNFTGVDVSIDVLDSNGNYRNIGSATTDATGYFTFTWKPDIPGDFRVIASFAGTNGYWPSSAETSFNVMETPSTPAPTTTTSVASNTDTYIMGSAIIVVIIIVGAVLAVLTLRKRP